MYYSVNRNNPCCNSSWFTCILIIVKKWSVIIWSRFVPGMCLVQFGWSLGSKFLDFSWFLINFQKIKKLHSILGWWHIQISDVKPELSPDKLKVCKNGIFWAKNPFQKIFSMLFLSPNQSYVKKSGQQGL